jgi:6-phosphogluconolactonase
MRRTAWLSAALITAAACSRDATGPQMNESASQRLAVSATASVGRVYTESNGSAGNEVLAFTRHADGHLTSLGSFPTGGTGTGAGLGSQGSVLLSDDGHWLFAANAASNDITSFRVTESGLAKVTTVASGGTKPISLTSRRGLLYVLNAGGSGNITGFRIAPNGDLTPIAGSTRPLSTSASDPAQIGFGPSGFFLVVTEKATNKISTYLVNAAGVPSQPVVNPSVGQTPFGFAFDARGLLYVSEAFGGAVDASATSSYRVAENGTLQVISSSVGTTETAACWLVVTNDARFVYVTNTGSASVSGYSSTQGALQLVTAGGKTGQTGTTPIDAALSRGSQFLYNLNSGSHSITGFEVNSTTGALTSVPGATGLPAGAVGLAAS